jgi:hypothetical protein
MGRSDKVQDLLRYMADEATTPATAALYRLILDAAEESLRQPEPLLRLIEGGLNSQKKSPAG